MVIATDVEAQILPDVAGASGPLRQAMTPVHSRCLELDLHRLDLRFADSRLVEPRAVARIAQSIERCGQLVPCIVVAAHDGEGAEALVLVDGYRRVAALHRLGRDTASVEQWACDLTEALLGVLARSQDRPFAIIEEALLLRELVQERVDRKRRLAFEAEARRQSPLVAAAAQDPNSDEAAVMRELDANLEEFAREWK